jgi:cobalt-zinc-cadmium efflux system protein
MGHDHPHLHSHSHSHIPAGGSAGHARKLLQALALTASFLTIELIAAWLTNSLALLSDAAHMFTDSAALAIALAAIRIGQHPADRKRTFGYYRFEILAAAFNAVLLFLIAGYILWEAGQRLRVPAEIQSVPMLIVAFAGLVVNLVSMRVLESARDESLCVKSAYLEVWSDLIGSAGVMIAAAIIWLTGWTWVDSLVAALIGLWVLPRTWSLLKDSLNILLQGVPEGVDLDAIESALQEFPCVREVHALHVWAVTTGRHVMSAHLVVSPESFSNPAFLAEVVEAMEHRFGLTHTTIQLESSEAAPPH